MENCYFRNKVIAANMKPGFIYGGTPVGEFQIDNTGRYWWKRVDGSIQEIKPEPSRLFYIIKECGV